jgi:pimeloyl-ACP methyl ester carboxylesterase
MRTGQPFTDPHRQDGRRVAYQVVGQGDLDLAAVGSERAALFGCHTDGRLALMMAATYPDLVPAAVTLGSHPATLRDEDYPWGRPSRTTRACWR